jgi:hypothetical protein
MILSMTVKPGASSSDERALNIFEAHGGILRTNQAIRLGIHPRTLYVSMRSATTPSLSAWTEVSIGWQSPNLLTIPIW